MKRNQNLRKPVTHGTISGYKHYLCRCELCKSAFHEYENTRRQKKRDGYVFVGPKPIQHGTAAAYTHHRCRCDECDSYMKAYRKRKRKEKLNFVGPPRKKFRKVTYIDVPNGTKKEVFVEKQRQCGTAEAYSFGCKCDLCMTQGFNEYLREIAA